MSHEILVFAKVAEEACVVQMHDSMLLSSNIYVHRQPVICKLALERPEEKKNSLDPLFYTNADAK